MDSFLQDVRFGIRSLRKTRGLTLVAVLTLALGIGANTAIFSAVHAVLLRPLPFRDPGQLVRLYETEAAPGNYPFAAPDFLDWKSQNTTFQDMSLFGWGGDMNLSDGGRAEHIIAVVTESNFFSLLGARPLLGRTWAADEDQLGKEHEVILSYGLWQTQFGGDKNMVNRVIELNAKKYTVVGVMPPSFRYPSSAQVWVPQAMDSKSLYPRGSHWHNAVGRLKPGVTVQQAQAELSLIAKRLEDKYPQSNYKVGAVVLPLHEDMVGDWRASLLMMLWAVALVLLIACANVANLLLSRAVARQKEMAIRSALGAARARLIRQLLTESVLLAMIGGMLGLLVGGAGVRLLSGSKAFALPATNPIELNLPILAFTFALASLAGVLFGILPALQTSRPGLYDELKGGAGSAITSSRHRRFTSSALVVTEVGLSLLLLISAAFLIKDFLLMRQSNVGVRSDGVWTAAIMLPTAKYPKAQQQFDLAQQLLERARGIPGVESAALSNRLPLEGGNNGYVKIRGRVSHGMSGPLMENHNVSPGYFHVMGIPLIAGRDFTAQDVEATKALRERAEQLYAANDHPPAEITNSMVFPAVINQSMARYFWPNEDALGKMFSEGDDNGPWLQVIGVTGDVKQWSLVHAPVPEGYRALAGENRVFLVLHTSVAPASVTAAVRHALSELDSTLPLFNVRTMDGVIAVHASGQEFITGLLGLFAGLALLLASVGIYGVLSYLVTQRTREIGIRMSLGATRGNVLRLVLAHGMRLAIAGFVLGIGAAFASRRVLAGSLRMIKTNDPAMYAWASLALALVALAACYIPARRATKVDPMVALRCE